MGKPERLSVVSPWGEPLKMWAVSWFSRVSKSRHCTLCTGDTWLSQLPEEQRTVRGDSPRSVQRLVLTCLLPELPEMLKSASVQHCPLKNLLLFKMKWPKIFSVAGIDPRPLPTHNYPSLSLSQAWLWCPGFGRSRGPAWRRLTAWFLPANAWGPIRSQPTAPSSPQASL